MATKEESYSSPSYTIIRQQSHTAVNTTAGIQPVLTFRSRVAAVVTGIGVVLASVSSVTLILTLLHNGSVAAILTLSNSANEVAREFTLTVNRTLTSITDRFEVSTAKDKGDITVVYEWRIVPGTAYSLNAALT
tara:strand:- start:3285 stop:3686 length:402 start_codon:yes stop_codon:yes gene_type:complete